MDTKRNSMGIIISIIIVVTIVGYSFYYMRDNNQTTSTATSTNQTSMDTIKQPNGLEITILKEGAGAEAQNGQLVTVHYIGTLEDGSKFDASYDHGQPFSFTLGAGQVIKGWEEGVLGMKVGEKRKLVIPSALGYGASGVGPIPGNATLIFEVELLGTK